MTERIMGWQCIGCGRIEAPQQCIGICRDRKAEFVDAADYDRLVAELEAERNRADALAAVVRRVAGTTPKKDGCVRTWLAIQARARQVLGAGRG